MANAISGAVSAGGDGGLGGLEAQMKAAQEQEIQMQMLQSQNDQAQEKLQAQSSIEQSRHDTAMSICKSIAQ